MSFRNFINDEVVIVNSAGERSELLPCVFAQDSIRIFEEALRVVEGDKVLRTLPDGVTESYTVLEVNYFREQSGFPANYKLRTRKDTSLMPAGGGKTTNVTISHSHGFQVGDHNVQQILNSFAQLAQEIESSDAPTEQKAEAKARLLGLLSHPLVNTFLGAGASGLVESLSS